MGRYLFSMSRWDMTCLVVGIALFFGVSGMVAGASDIGAIGVSSGTILENSNLPIILIDTRGVPIPDGRKIDAEMRIIFNGPGRRNAVTDPPNAYEGRIGIEIRGSSSTSWPKKQWNIETRNPDRSNRNVSLLGLPAENDWILNGPFIDRSMMRDVLIFRLSRDMGRYASRSRFCEVILNGQYQGVYVLLEKIKRDPARVAISKLTLQDNTGDALTGGYILKVDKPGNDFFLSKYPPIPGSKLRVFYQYHEPQDELITPAQKAYIQGWMGAFEDLMASPRFTDPVHGYVRYLDVGSAVDHFILNELAKNVDGFRLSAFMYKDRDSKDGRLHLGPIWDFNLGFGNANYYDAHTPEGWEILHFRTSGDYSLPPFWWYRLLEDPLFWRRIAERWRTLRSDVLHVARIHGLMDAMADTLAEAVGRNFAIWPGPGQPGTGFWPVPWIFYTFTTYRDEIDFLKDWIARRIAWMDAELSRQSPVAVSPEEERPLFRLFPCRPNPFNRQTVIRFESYGDGPVLLVLYDVLGRPVRTLWHGPSTGSFEVLFDGIDPEGRPLPAGVYIARLSMGAYWQAVKMILSP